MKIITMLSLISLITWSCLADSSPTKKNHSKLLAAICQVESNCDSSKVGLAGEIGMYQILYVYWFDAVEHDPTIGGSYKDCLDKQYSEGIIYAYWNRYCNERRLGRKPTDEDRARIHNRGPNGYKKESSIKYWKKVKVYLNE